MYSQKKDNFCAQCGAENIREPWMKSMDNDGYINLCSNCQKETGNGNYFTRFLILAVLMSGLLMYLNKTFDALSFKDDPGQIIYEILLVLIISSGLASGKMWQKIKYLAVWGLIFLVSMTVYTYRHDIFGIKDKVLAEFIPSKGFSNTPYEISFPVSSDGHFYIQVEVNGIPVIFMADTGASHIVLSPRDAEKVGIDRDRLIFDRFYETANGTVRGSSVRITDFRVGEIIFKDIGASVNEAEMKNSLLGMTFFKRLKSYDVKDDV
jgi:aspartyl protease family protein